jgi:hypothetical protein
LREGTQGDEETRQGHEERCSSHAEMFDPV